MIPMAALLDLFLSLVVTSILAHPHVPKSLVLHGAAGKVTLAYQTVDFNAEHLQQLKPGFSWFMAFANLHNEMPLTCAGQKIPAGHYKLNMLRGATAADWQLELLDFEWWQQSSRAQRARGRGGEAALEELREKLEQQAIPERLVFDLQDFEGHHAEHLELNILLEGYATVGLFDATPTKGVQFVLRFSFGDLHKSLRFAEDFGN